MAKTAKRFYKPSELAQVWGCSHTRVLQLIRSGELPAFSIATKPEVRPYYRVPIESVKAFWAARRVVPKSKR